MYKELTLNKAVAALVGVAMAAGLAFTFAAERAHAVTLSELIELFIALDIIPADKAAEARAVLENQPEETTTPAPSTGGQMSCNFTRNLKQGVSGQDVMDLQKLLNLSADTKVSAAGAGSPGMETSFFGPATAAAVSKFQVKYAAEILTPLGLTSGTGIFGASSRAKANALCAGGTPGTPGVPGVPGVPGTPGDDDDDATDDEDLSGGEASLEDFKRSSSPSSAEVGENADEVEVAGFEFDVEDADVAVKRVDVRFEATAGDASYSKKPYEYFDSVQLLVDGEQVAEVDAGAKADWEDLAGDAWEVTFTGLDEIIKEGDKAKITIAVTSGSYDSEDDKTTWNVWIPNQGIRTRDGAGIDQYVGDTDLLSGASYERQFTTEPAGQGEELKVSLSSSNPNASTIRVDADDATDDVTVLVFELKAEESDIEVTELPIRFDIGTDNFDEMVSDVSLEIDGDTFDTYTTQNGGTGVASTTFTFDTEELVIEAGEKVTVKVIVDFLKTTGNFDNSDTIKASLNDIEVDAIEAEGAETLLAADLTGTAVGDTHTAQSEGLFAEIVSIDETKTAGDNNANDVGDFKIKFDLTAFDDTFYVSATTSAVFVYHVEDGNGNTVSTTTTAAVTSTATKEGSAYRINDGGSESVTLTVSLNPDVTGFYRVELDSITYGTTAALPYGSSHTAAPDEDFESDNLSLNK